MEATNEAQITEKPKREQQKIYAVINEISEINCYYCTIEAPNLKELQAHLDKLNINYAIVGLFKGKALHFTETKQIKLV